MLRLICLFGLAALCLGHPAAARDIDFGDDASEYANDGECDDPRFAGDGMTTTPLLEADIAHDATDCRTAFEAGTIALAGDGTAAEDAVIDGIDFGDDTSQFANDGECDDPRFQGPGTATTLLESDRAHDATDCAAAYREGRVTLVTEDGPAETIQIDGIDFGDDTGAYPMDGECDDPRFQGPAMATALDDANIGRDATDCSTAYGEGRVQPADAAPADSATIVDGIDFGDNASPYANDGECDDPRFEGPGMTTTLLRDEDAYHDAADCSAAWLDGGLSLRGGTDIGRDDGGADWGAPAIGRRPAAVSQAERAARRANR